MSLVVEDVGPYIQDNLLAPGRFEWHFLQVIFKLISLTDGLGISCEISVRWISLVVSDEKSVFVQVMAWQGSTLKVVRSSNPT